MAPEKVNKVKEEDDCDDNETLVSIPRDRDKSKTKKPSSADNANPRFKSEKVNNEKQEEEGFSDEKKTVAGASSKKLARPKKDEQLYSDSDDNKPISRRTPADNDKKAIKLKEEGRKRKNEVPETNTRKRERKAYDLPGQKRDPPEERDPLRIFYETLYQQVPGSEMAAIWMMESGLLPAEVAKEVYGRKQKRSQLSRLGSPVKAVASANKSTNIGTVKKEVMKSSGKSSLVKMEVSSHSKKWKKGESSEEEDSGDEFIMPRRTKKATAAQ